MKTDQSCTHGSLSTSSMSCPFSGQSDDSCTGASVGRMGGNQDPHPRPTPHCCLQQELSAHPSQPGLNVNPCSILYIDIRQSCRKKSIALMSQRMIPWIHEKTCCMFSQMENCSSSPVLRCAFAICPHHKCRSDGPEQHVYLLSQGAVSSLTYWKALHKEDERSGTTAQRRCAWKFKKFMIKPLHFSLINSFTKVNS